MHNLLNELFELVGVIGCCYIVFIFFKTIFKYLYSSKTPKKPRIEKRIEKRNVRRAIINIIDDEDKKYTLYIVGIASKENKLYVIGSVIDYYETMYITKVEKLIDSWFENNKKRGFIKLEKGQHLPVHRVKNLDVSFEDYEIDVEICD